ncbi:hypothetical protein OHT20_07500 [Streptomyces caniferus]|uniref:hypothetical protein n=1 Tax=Streptomyces caniferus TaxID=285557 RepID=UPI002E2DDD6B|nr:hypothetical protein [Streptomyces caniferus]
MAFRKQSHAAFQILDLLSELPDSLSHQAQGHTGDLQHRLFLALVVLAVVGEPCAGTEEFRIVKPGQLFPQIRVSGNEDGLELIDRLGAGLDRRPLVSFYIRAICTGPSPDLARARARPLSAARAAFWASSGSDLPR